MSELERAQQLLNTIPYDKLGYVIAYMQGIACSNESSETHYDGKELEKKVEKAIRNCDSQISLPKSAYIDAVGAFHSSSHINL